MSQVAVYDDNTIGTPAECDRSLAQRVLTFGALDVFQHLTRRRLTDIQVSVSFQVGGSYFLQVG